MLDEPLLEAGLDGGVSVPLLDGGVSVLLLLKKEQSGQGYGQGPPNTLCFERFKPSWSTQYAICTHLYFSHLLEHVFVVTHGFKKMVVSKLLLQFSVLVGSFVVIFLVSL